MNFSNWLHPSARVGDYRMLSFAPHIISSFCDSIFFPSFISLFADHLAGPKTRDVESLGRVFLLFSHQQYAAGCVCYKGSGAYANQCPSHQFISHCCCCCSLFLSFSFFFLTTGFSLWTPRRTEPFPPQRFGSHLLYPLRTTVSARALIHRVTSSLMGETTAETKGPKSSPLVKTDKGGIHLSFYCRDSYIGKS